MMRLAAFGTALLLIVLFGQPGAAHKGITSKFTYNADVYPIFVNRCGRCHVEGGVAPMSLVKYEDAFPWAESLRTELLEPSPGTADFVRASHRQISARELDIVLDWATGGTPEGDKTQATPPVLLRNEWAHGAPDLAVSVPAPYTMPAEALEAAAEFILPLPLAVPRSAAGLDVLPGNPAIVRSAVISVRSQDGGLRELGTWFPRQVPIALALKPVARLEPGSEIIARIQYKKTWKHEGQAMQDQSTIGFYLAD
jgi:hypothetical protein